MDVNGPAADNFMQRTVHLTGKGPICRMPQELSIYLEDDYSVKKMK
jgi:hypothetical protein